MLEKHDSYPGIHLHDCDFTIRLEDKVLIFDFENGFWTQTPEGQYRLVAGQIHISDFSLEDLEIRVVKESRLFKRRAIVRRLSLAALAPLFRERFLQVVNEYYSQKELVWECVVHPFCGKLRRKFGDWAIIRVFSEAPRKYVYEENEQ